MDRWGRFGGPIHQVKCGHVSGLRSSGGLSQEGKNNSEVQPKECYFGRELRPCRKRQW